MNERENIPEESQELPASSGARPETISDKPETAPMEGYKHPHQVMHKKKLTEYALEFLMLFLAITLSFFAENMREMNKPKSLSIFSII